MRTKATITLDRAKVARAADMVGARSMSDVVDIALERLIRDEELRLDVAAYRRQPRDADDLDIADLAVELDLADEDVDYERMYGAEE